MYDSAKPTQRISWGTTQAPIGSANGASNPLNVGQYKYATITIITSGFTGTVKLAGSSQDATIDFAAASEDGNAWETQLADDLEDGASIVGDTGIAFTLDTGVRHLRLNADMLHWLGFVLSGVSAGTIKIDVKLGNDEK